MNPAIAAVVEAFNRQDYRLAARLLNPLLAAEPEDPWIRLYAARLHEMSGRMEVAEPLYRQLLQVSDFPNPKILTQARQGLERLAASQRAHRRAEVDLARSSPEGARPGLLVLEPLGGDRRSAALEFAKIFDLDAYSARLQLPARSWRLYRSGPLGELKFYAEQLQQAGLPCFWADLEALSRPKLFQVVALEAALPKAIALCQADTGQLGQLTFDWSEVVVWVSGEVPTFESVVDLNARGQVIRKQQTQDWLKVEDIHLGDRGCVLRFCEASYQFDRGVRVEPIGITGQAAGSPTRRTRWNGVAAFLARQLAQVPHAKDFSGFADTAIDWPHLLEGFSDRLPILRDEPCELDAALHLYSLLARVRLR